MYVSENTTIWFSFAIISNFSDNPEVVKMSNICNHQSVAVNKIQMKWWFSFSQVVEEYGSKTLGVFVITIKQYLENFWPNFTEAHVLYESLKCSVENTNAKGTSSLKTLIVLNSLWKHSAYIYYFNWFFFFVNYCCDHYIENESLTFFFIFFPK